MDSDAYELKDHRFTLGNYGMLWFERNCNLGLVQFEGGGGSTGQAFSLRLSQRKAR